MRDLGFGFMVAAIVTIAVAVCLLFLHPIGNRKPTSWDGDIHLDPEKGYWTDDRFVLYLTGPTADGVYVSPELTDCLTFDFSAKKITVCGDGSVEFSGDMTESEAAKAFWDAVQLMGLEMCKEKADD